jgi:hypothetical protein
MELASTVERVLDAIDTPQGFPEPIVRAIQALPISTTIYPDYYLDGDLAHELRDLLAMIHHAVLRGATRVRLLIR